MEQKSPLHSDSKLLLASWLLVGVIAFLLWYRNSSFDRVLSLFVFSLALTILAIYSLCNQSDPKLISKFMRFIMIIQVLVLFGGLMIFFRVNKSSLFYLATVGVILTAAYLIALVFFRFPAIPWLYGVSILLGILLITAYLRTVSSLILPLMIILAGILGLSMQNDMNKNLQFLYDKPEILSYWLFAFAAVIWLGVA